MTVSRRQALAAGAVALPAAALTAAQPPATAPTAARGGQNTAQSGADPYLAACLLGGGKRQIEVCRFAQPKLQDEELKAFSQAEIDEHETMKADLAKLGYQPPAPAGGAVQPAGGRADDGRVQPAGGRADARAAEAGPTVSVGKHTFTPGVSTVLLIETEVAEQCIANTKAALTKCEAKGKAKFDKAFVGDQLHTHMGLLDKVTTFQKHATQEMQPGLKKAEEIIRQHIAACEKLMEKCELAAMKEMTGAGGSRPDRQDK